MTSSIWGKNFVYGCSTKLDRGGRLAQCGNLMIFLSIRFHAKSIMANLVSKTAILTASITVVKMFFECGTVCVCRVAFSKSKEFCLWMINHVWNSWSNYVWLPKSRKIPFNYLHIDCKCIHIKAISSKSLSKIFMEHICRAKWKLVKVVKKSQIFGQF